MPKHKVQSAGELIRLRGSTHGLSHGCRVLTGLYRCCCARWKNTRGTEQQAKRAGVRPSSCCEAVLEGPLLPNRRIRAESNNSDCIAAGCDLARGASQK